MSFCRIYLFTYKRHELFPRALNSLLAQTVTDWVCEIHNDDPDDSFIENYLTGVNDKRLILKKHEQNWGPVKSFNLAFARCDEQYASILEDDNWWDPRFLEKMTNLLNQYPEVDVAWANMRLWQEKAGNQWDNTGRTTWSQPGNIFFNWPHQQQVIGHLHSNGSMLFRTRNAKEYVIPDNTLFNAIELVRERAFKYPIVLMHEPLANFAITINTNRSNSQYDWIVHQVMMLASYVAASSDQRFAFQQSLSIQRKQKPIAINCFFLANLLILRDSAFYRLFSIKDWFAIGKWLLKHGRKLSLMRKYLSQQRNVYEFLMERTVIRQRSVKQDGIKEY